MEHHGTQAQERLILSWLLWLGVVLASLMSVAGLPPSQWVPLQEAVSGVCCHDRRRHGPLFAWESRRRYRKWAWRRYKAWRKKRQRAHRQRQRAQLAQRGLQSLADIVDYCTAYQLHYKLGALPVLYALLEKLEVRSIINRHCATRADVDNGAVALVLIINRLILPLPLYQISDWVGQTVLTAVLNVPATKFNDDRLGRTLDALYPQLDTVWREIVEVAIVKAQVDLSLIFYDLTGVVGHGQYADSELLDFGFAHNTPANKRKLKVGLNVSADGNLPWYYRLWSGRTADQATVQENLQQLARWLVQHGYQPQATMMVGDRAMLSSELALAYDEQGLRHLTGLRATHKEHRALLPVWDDAAFAQHPLVAGPEPQYWGRPCEVPFEHEGQRTRHKGLVVLAGPLRDQLRDQRESRLQWLDEELTTLRSRLGQPRLRTEKAVQRSVTARLKKSKVADFMEVRCYTNPQGQVQLHWQRNTEAIAQAARYDGRYLLVTNEWRLTPQEMFRRYRAKDAVETCFHVSKADLKVSPLYLHSDERIAAMLFINMVALLAYNLLQSQMQKQGVALTTRQLIKRLDRLELIETCCWDGSRLQRLSPPDPELLGLLQMVGEALSAMVQQVVEPSASLPRPAAWQLTASPDPPLYALPT